MTHDEALERVQKLLRLAKSDNANEAATAAAMAQRLIDLHKLDVAALKDESAAEPIEDKHEPIDRQYSTWRARLAVNIATLNGAKCYRDGKALCLVGRKSDVQTVRYLYQWLTQEVERLADNQPSGLGKTWYNNFRLGVIETLIVRLEEQKKATEKEAMTNAFNTGGQLAASNVGAAIVRVAQDSAAVEKWAEDNMKLRRGSSSRSNYDDGARQQGRRAGHSVGLGGNGRSMGAGASRLNG